MRSMSATPCAVTLKASRFSHADAEAMSKWILRRESAQTVVVDLSAATDASTAAFARLVVLRRHLLRRGRDLTVSGLRDRALWLYAISRLDLVLPQEPEPPPLDKAA